MAARPVRRRFVALASTLGMLLVVIGAARPATADPIGDKKAEAAKIAAKVDQLNGQIEILAEQYNDAQLKLAGVRDQIAGAKAKVDAAKAEMAQRKKELQAFAVQAYVSGSMASSLPVVLTSKDGSSASERTGYMSAAVGNRQDLIDRLHATQEDLDTQISELGSAEDSAKSATDQLSSKKKAAESATNQQKALLAQTQGQLAALVQAEQARIAAAQAKAAAARQAARPVSRPPAGGRSGGGGTVASPPAPNGGAAAAVAEAKRQLGVRYTWAGSSPSTGFDCSGLTMWAWRAGGRSLPHSSAGQWSSTTHIPMSAIQPGDLIFYGHPVHHVGIYVGGGQIIHAPHEGGVVQYDSVYYWDDLVGAGRVG